MHRGMTTALLKTSDLSGLPLLPGMLVQVDIIGVEAGGDKRSRQLKINTRLRG